MLLVFGQQAALRHELTHVPTPASRTAPADKSSAPHKLCDQCASFAHLAGAAPATPAAFVPPPASFLPIAAIIVVAVRGGVSLHRNRGPPRFL